MSAGGQIAIPPISTTIDNESEWPAISAELKGLTGLETVLTPEFIAGMLADAVPLLFAADNAKNVDILRGTFSDAVVAQCARYSGALNGVKPSSTVAHLVGARMVNGATTLRLHLMTQLQPNDDGQTTSSQFWDLQLGANAVVGQTACPNCGAPIVGGALICTHCHTDVRSSATVPLVVSKLEIY